jgi:hypothetical protein
MPEPPGQRYVGPGDPNRHLASKAHLDNEAAGMDELPGSGHCPHRGTGHRHDQSEPEPEGKLTHGSRPVRRIHTAKACADLYPEGSLLTQAASEGSEGAEGIPGFSGDPERFGVASLRLYP